jgi:hypothetical protein
MRLFDLWGQRGWADHDVVGESHYFDHIRSLLPKPDGDESEAQTVAQLVPEPSNIHDPNAVAVKCGGGVVGYLSRDEASVYFQILSALVAQGWMPQVAARIWGGHRSAYDYDNGTLVDGRDFIGSVRLDLAEPHLIVPVNTHGPGVVAA